MSATATAATAQRTVYAVECVRSGTWWALEVPGLKGIHTQAKRLDQTEDMARDAIATMLDVPPDSFDIAIDLKLTAYADDAVGELEQARRDAAAAQAALGDAAYQAAATLVKDMGLTVRDAGRILGVSHQRVDQLLHRR